MTGHIEYIKGHTPDRRRTIRIKRSALLKDKLDDIDRPSIKIAETNDELEQAFSLVQQEYLRSGYIKEPNPSGMHCTIYNILPETAVFIFKSYLKVVATLTLILDNEHFGLPMDAIYQKELNVLRDKDRKLAELSALAVPRELRWHNLFMYLFRAMYWYAVYNKVNDLCIMINPKHVKFYKTIFFFEEFGEEKFYPKVGAPAVALRLNLDIIEDKVREKYSPLDFDCDLLSFFRRTRGILSIDNENLFRNKRVMDAGAIKYFFIEKSDILINESTDNINYIKSLYPEIAI